MLDIRHSSNCKRSRRSVVPFDILQHAVRLPFHKNKSRRALQTFHESEDTTIIESLLKNGINTVTGSKSFKRQIENRQYAEKKKRKRITANSRKTFSVADILLIISTYFMDIETFCAHASDDAFIAANLDKIVVLRSDVGTKVDNRSSGFVFTTIGRLLILKKVIKMYEWKVKNHLGISAVTMQTDGLVIFKPHTLKAVHLAFSGFLHQTFVVFFAISREEDKIISLMLMGVAKEVIHKLMKLILKLEEPGRLHSLIDGGRALHAAAIELGLLVENCKHHMSDRSTGIGTAGYNQCGSLGRYLKSMMIEKVARMLFEWTNQNLFYMFQAKEAQRIATLMLYKYMLGVWLPIESKGEIQAMVESTATLDDVQAFLKNEFKNYAGLVESENSEINQVTGPRKHKCMKIIIWFVHYYFKIIGEFTHGSIHNPGDPLNTNGLEGTNYPFQIHATEIYDSKPVNEIEAYMMCVQQKTLIPDNFQDSPSSTMAEWDLVFELCKNKKKNNEPIPNLFQYMFGFEGNGQYNHIPWEILVNELTSLRKDGIGGDKKIILYIPTRTNYVQTSIEERESLNQQINQGGYPSNSTTSKRICKEEDLFPILYPAFVKQLYGKHGSSVVTNVSLHHLSNFI